MEHLWPLAHCGAALLEHISQPVSPGASFQGESFCPAFVETPIALTLSAICKEGAWSRHDLKSRKGSIVLDVAGLRDYCRDMEAGILCDLNRIKISGAESFRTPSTHTPKLDKLRHPARLAQSNGIRVHASAFFDTAAACALMEPVMRPAGAAVQGYEWFAVKSSAKPDGTALIASVPSKERQAASDTESQRCTLVR